MQTALAQLDQLDSSIEGMGIDIPSPLQLFVTYDTNKCVACACQQVPSGALLCASVCVQARSHDLPHTCVCHSSVRATLPAGSAPSACQSLDRCCTTWMASRWVSGMLQAAIAHQRVLAKAAVAATCTPHP